MKKILSFILTVLMLCSFTACTQQAPSSEQDSIVSAYVEKAEEFIASGDYTSAIAVLEEGISATNSDTLKEMLEKTKEEAAVQEQAALIESYKQQAETFVANGDYDSAIAILEEGIVATNDDGLKDMLEKLQRENAPVSVIGTLSSSESRELNIFLSNFSEAYYDPDSTYCTNPNEQKLNFAYLHSKINYNTIQYFSPSYYGISATEVDRILNRFFGYSIPHSAPAGSTDWKYENGYFLTPAADGDSYSRFSLASDMYPNDDGTYKVTFNIYSDTSVTGGDVITDKSVYSLTPQTVYSRCEYLASGEATVKPKVHNGKNTYELIDYKVG